MTAYNTLAAPAPTRRRSTHIIVWTLQILLALFMVVVSAAPKLAGQRDAVETFTEIGWGQWFRYFTGTVEVLGGIGLLIPRLAASAALGLVGVMVGAVLTHLLVLEPNWALFPAGLGIVFGLIARVRWPEAKGLAGLVKR